MLLTRDIWDYPKGGEGVSHVKSWRKITTKRRTNLCKGLLGPGHAQDLRHSKEAGEAGAEQVRGRKSSRK